jgi:uncharacterized protein YdeI (BOF family)
MTVQYAKQRIIKDITVDDERIQVTGYLKNKIDNELFVLDDDTGKINVNFNRIDNFNFKTNDLINVIGDLELHSSGEKLINADIIQDMNKLNFEYYQKIYQLKKELN